LRDAGEYIAALPKQEHDAPKWQAATGALLLGAERGGPTKLAPNGFMRALNRHPAQVFSSGQKKPHRGRRKLKRDQ